MISLSVLYGFFCKELKQVLRDKRMKFILFGAPIIQFVIFGLAISADIKNIRIWAKPTSSDYILEHIYQHSLASGWFLPANNYNKNIEAFELLKGGKIDTALIPVPGGLTKYLDKQKADMQVLIDATNVVKAQSIEMYIKSITHSVVLQDLKTSLPDPPIQFAVRILFNPELRTTDFMIPGVMCMLLCVISIILTSASITNEKEIGTFEMLISAPISATEIILGKTVPYVVLAMCDVPLLLFASIVIFGVPMRGSMLVLFLASFAFVCSNVAIGVLISTFAKNQQQSVLGSFLFLFPASMFSGLMFPLENMPLIMQFFSYLDPLSHFLYLLRSIMLKGSDFSFIVWHTSVLFAMAGVFVYISFKRFRTTLQ